MNLFTIKPTDALFPNSILVRKSTCFGHFVCPKHVDFRTRIEFGNSASVGSIVKKFITIHGHMDVKLLMSRSFSRSL